MRAIAMFAVLGSMLASAPTGGKLGRAPTSADSFPEQWEYVISTSRKNAVCCSRQAGKTTGAELAAEVVLSRPSTRVIYATLIRRNAKKLFWWPLLEGLTKRGWEPRDEANETEMMLWLPNGSFLQALSCEKMADLERIRGDQADLFLIDECQAPRNDVLGALATKIVPMMLAKRRGRLDLLGTVPEAEPCVFSNRLDGIDEDGRALEGWRTFKWSCFDNPHMDPEGVKAEARESGLVPCDCADPKKCEVSGHIIYAREVLGERKKDPRKLAYEYMAGRNDYDPATVDFTARPYRHAGGLDLGFSDHDAISVGSWDKEDAKRRLFGRWAWQHRHLDIDDLAGVVEAVCAAFPGIVWTGDHGGHGAVIVLVTLQRRLRLSLGVKPPDVMVSAGLVNDDFRTSRFLLPSQDTGTALVLAAHKALVKTGRQLNGLPRDSARDARTEALIVAGGGAPLRKELGMVTKRPKPGDPSKMEINKQGFHSDLSESNRDMHHAARHWAARAPKPEPTLEERRRAWELRQQRELEDPYGD